MFQIVFFLIYWKVWLIASNKLHTGVLWARTTLTSFFFHPPSLVPACMPGLEQYLVSQANTIRLLSNDVTRGESPEYTLSGLKKQRNVCLRFTEAPDWEHQEGYFFTRVHRSLTLKRLSTLRAPPPTRGADHQALRGNLYLAAEWVQFLSIRLSWVQLIPSSFLSEFR